MGQQWKGSLQGGGQRHALITSRWNDFITDALLEGAVESLLSLGVQEEDIDIIYVAGAFELGPTALITARSKTQAYDALICLGCVIRGDTPHFEYVSGESARLISQASYDSGIPVIFGVLTTDTVEQAMERASVKKNTKGENKGAEAAQCAVEMASLYRQLKNKG